MPLTTAAVAQHLFDAIALVVVVGMIAGYQAYLRALARRNPAAVLSRVASIQRAAWVETMMADRNNGVLAIQTLRNSTMAATFLASTSILLMVGVLTLSGQAPALKSAWHYLNVAGSLGPELWMVKLLTLLLLLFFAFYCFTNAIRIFNHVGYMINVREGAQEIRLSSLQIASELNRGGRFYSIGTRTYYYLVPFVFWLFGPIYMVIAVVVLVVIMLPRIDKTPAQMRKQ
jgi:uncharacterized membrane protein